MKRYDILSKMRRKVATRVWDSEDPNITKHKSEHERKYIKQLLSKTLIELKGTRAEDPRRVRDPSCPRLPRIPQKLDLKYQQTPSVGVERSLYSQR